MICLTNQVVDLQQRPDVRFLTLRINVEDGDLLEDL